MIYYWNGAFTSIGLSDETTNNAVQKLITGDYAPSDLEKLHGQSQSSPIIYSYRISAKARLLFTTHKRSLHVLEYLPHHNYSRSRFLRAGVLRNYLAGVDALKENVIFAPLDKDEQKPSYASESTNHLPKGLDYYNNQFISFSEAQASVLHQLQLPLILNGAAGTGKSYLGFGMIQHKLQESLNSPIRCLYITDETVLTSSMRANWENYFALDSTSDIHFKTYAELFSNEHTDLEIVGRPFFNKWFLAFKSGPKVPSISIDACYQEFRICSGLSKEAYAALGMRQSSIEQGSGRDTLYEFYLQYLVFLGTKQADPAFFSWSEMSINNEGNRYDFIVVDEAHRFSLLQNKTLARLVRNHAIVYCMDSLQNLVDQYSSRVLLELELRDVGVQTHTLDKAYRYTINVAKALDQVLENNRLIMGKGDKQEANVISTGRETSEGELHFITPEEVEHTDWLIERAEGVHLAIVTHELLVAEARSVFNTALVFTPSQIQGQEFHTVVVYKLLSDEYSQKTLKKIKGQLASENRSTGHRSKDKASHSYSPWAHAIFTACSRAMDSLIIVDHPNGYWERLTSNTTNLNVSPAPAVPTSHMERVAMVDKQANLGNTEIAALLNQSLDNQRLIRTRLVSGHKKECSSRKPASSRAVLNIPSAPIFDEALGVRLLLLVNKTLTSKVLNEIKLLINNPKTNLNQINEHGATVAMMMVLNDVPAILSPLLEQGKRVDWEQQDKQGFNALMLAAGRRRVEMARAILTQNLDMNLNQVSYEGVTALMLAAEYGPTEMATLLLEHSQRIDLNQTNNRGSTALMFAIQYNHIEIVSDLLKLNHINLNQIGKEGRIPLCVAIYFEHIDIIRLLLMQGERINLLGLEPLDAPLVKVLELAKTRKSHREILGMLFGDTHVLKTLIKYEVIFSSLDSYLAKNPLFIGMCIKQREHVWEILKSLKESDLSCDEYHNMLNDISNAKLTTDRFYALSQILFKKIVTNHIHSSPENGQSLSIRQELENEISGSQADLMAKV